MQSDITYCAFAGERLLARGELAAVLTAAKKQLAHEPHANLLIFEEQTGSRVEFDLNAPTSEVVARVGKPNVRVGPGRPKLGVISREVSLLPRHWEWLEQEPQGISATLRRLVEEARKKNPGEQQRRLAREAVHRFIWVMAGNCPHFEEATRALFAQEDARFRELIADFPADVRAQALRLLEAVK